MDKSGWGDGPWQTEPDTVSWTDPATGYACRLARNPLGALCGYVALPAGHPWNGLDYDHADLAGVMVHGGLTYAGHAVAGSPAWWLGFDCAHAGDLMPGNRFFFADPGNGTYRTVAYVRGQCALLAAQAADASWLDCGYILRAVPDLP